MKKFLAFIFIVLLIVLSLSACSEKGDTSADESSAPLNGSVKDNVTTTNEDKDNKEMVSNTESETVSHAPESLMSKLILEIDAAYKEEQRIPENGTTLGMIELANEYTEKWKQVAGEYYDKLMKYVGIEQWDENSYTDSDFHTFISNMKTNWEDYSQKQSDNYLKILQTVYGGGTIIGPLMAEYKYELQMEWALQLVEIYQQLHI